MSLRRKIFYGFTVAALLVVLLLPATRWLVRLQFVPVYPGGTTGMNYIAGMNENDEEMDAAFHHTASKQQRDFGLQYAVAVSPSGSEEPIARLSQLQKQFPKESIIQAGLLRLMCAKLIHIDRPEQDLLLPPRSEPRASKEESTPADLARFDALAAQGESLEPDNGFFSAMRAIGYFAGHKDIEAVAAWRRAAEKTEWNDHIQEEAAARTRLVQTLNGGGEIGFLLRIYSSSNMLFPHYGRMRAAARMAIAKAVEEEVAGNTEEGFILRRATRQIGDNISHKQGSTGSSLAGGAIVSISQSRPGGSPATNNTEHGPNSSKHYQERQRTDYIAYLKKIDHPEEAIAFQAAMDREEQVRAIYNTGLSQSYIGFSKKTVELLFCWFGDGLLIMGILFSLVFAGIFGVIFRFSPRLQKGEPLQASAYWGVIFATVVFITAIPAIRLSDNFANPLWGLFGGSVLLGVIVPPLLMRLTGRQIGHGLLVGLATFSAIGLIFGVMVLSGGLFRGTMMAFGFVNIGEEIGGMPDPTKTSMLPSLISSGLMLLPILMICLFALFSYILRIPVASGVTRGMRTTGVPLACMLVFVYIGCLLMTLRHENAAIVEMKHRDAVGELQMYIDIARTH